MSGEPSSSMKPPDLASIRRTRSSSAANETNVPSGLQLKPAATLVNMTPSGKSRPRLSFFCDCAQHTVIFTLDSRMRKQLLIAHVDPYLAVQVANSALFREVVGACPAAKRCEVLHRSRHAHF